MNKALSVTDILSKKYKLLDLQGPWLEAFDRPEATGTWFVWGNSGNGKTSFLLQMIKELSRFGKVLYNSLEEGAAHTMQQALSRSGIQDCKGKLQLVCESMEDLRTRLKRHQSPNIIAIDSFQYTGMNFKDYLDLKKEFPRKLFIYNSQCEGKLPIGKAAVKVHYDASLKIWVEGYKAFSKGRYIGQNGGEYIIWEEGARKYWGN